MRHQPDDDGRALADGEVGEIFMRADFAPDFEHLNLPAERAKVECDGFITADDIGYLDKDGFLFICDRRRDMVISGGANIYPSEIEAVLLGMPGVRDCAVFGAPDTEMGENLVAVVLPVEDETLAAEAVRKWLRDRIARYKVPKLVEFATDLPREDSGKVFERRLRDVYWADAGRRI